MGGYRTHILTNGTRTYLEAAVLVHPLLQFGIVLDAQLSDEGLLRIARIAFVAPWVHDFPHSLLKHFASDTQRVAKVESIEVLHLAHRHHQVVGWLVIHQQVAVAVVNLSTCRIDGLGEEGVVARHSLILVIHNLKVEQTQNVNEEDQQNQSSNYKATFFEFKIVLHASSYLFAAANSKAIQKPKVNPMLISTLTSMTGRLNKVNDSMI